ncbi:MAG: hypothetical protein ACRERU_01050 [Methylococcales bacterium]
MVEVGFDPVRRFAGRCDLWTPVADRDPVDSPPLGQIGLLTLKRDPKSPLVHAFRILIQQIDVQAAIEQLIGSIY